MSTHEPFFTFFSKDDELMVQFATQDALRKKYLGAKLNYKEAGIVICWYTIERVRVTHV